ncbi:Arc family DNA-binding protein [Acinetobacter sp. C32I]|uniref:Arc family DNA-binding protein n=1 Tax=Acinetobacter sp. C32I TaxID=2950074 RepID=UPI002036809B|nr:Arc family DNA-binding protein [Acinetobacter sp. C32I]USA54581.1 Arc family DNA-binding protein [Acinetobacter sp. C32I]
MADIQFNLRIPAELKEHIAEAAKENNRSLNAEAQSRLEESFIDAIPADGLPKLIAAYFMGMYSRYSSEKDNLLNLFKKDPENQELKREIEKYDFLISELKSNAERLFPDAFKKAP